MQDPLVEVKNLNLIYDIGTPRETHALKDINLKIYPNEYVIFFGPSGCGKSTLLYCISGLLTPTNGEVLILDEDITKFSSGKMANFHRKTMGIIFQAFNLIPTLPILDNVALPQTWRGATAKSREARAKEVLSEFGLEHAAKYLPQELSGGQQQRVAIARSLMNDPPLILGDEPVGNLDSKAAQIVLDVFSNLNAKRKKTIILVTHNPAHFTYADRIVFMQDGKIVKEEINPMKVKPELMTEKAVKNMREKQTREFADALSDYFLNVSEIHLKDKMDELVSKNLKNEISMEELKKMAALPMRDGGLGFEEKRTEELVERLEVIIFESEILKHVSDEKARSLPLTKEVGELRRYVLSDYGKPLTFLRIKRLEEAIGSLIRGAIDGETFSKIAAMPEISGGIGFPASDAFRFLFKLKMVMKLR